MAVWSRSQATSSSHKHKPQALIFFFFSRWVPPTSSSLRQFVARQNNFLFFLFSLVGPAHKLFSATICMLTFFLGGSRPQALLCDILSRDILTHGSCATVRHIVTCDNSLLDVTFEQHCCHTATGCANQRTRRQHALFCGSRTRDL
jgi:hypothetical protein